MPAAVVVAVEGSDDLEHSQFQPEDLEERDESAGSSECTDSH